MEKKYLNYGMAIITQKKIIIKGNNKNDND